MYSLVICFISVLNAWQAMDPRTPVEQGFAHLRDNQLDMDLAELEKAIQLDPENPIVYNNRGLVYFNIGKYNEATLDFSKSIELDHNLAIAYSNRGLAYIATGQLDLAITDCDHAIQLDPTLAMAFSNRGWAYHNKGQYNQAITDYTKAIQLDANLVNAYINRGLAYLALGQLDNAIDDCNYAIRLDPTSALAFHNRGSVYRNKGQHDQAIADCTKAIELDPNLVEAFSNRGQAYLDKHQLDEAIADLSNAIHLKPTNAHLYVFRGLVRSDNKDYDKALADFDEAIRLDPRVASAHFGLAIVLFITRREGAGSEFMVVLDNEGWRGNLSSFAVLMGHLAARRIGQDDVARAFLHDAATRSDSSAWPFPIIKYFRGEITESVLLAAATDDNKLTEAHCYLGLKLLEEGRPGRPRSISVGLQSTATQRSSSTLSLSMNWTGTQRVRIPPRSLSPPAAQRQSRRRRSSILRLTEQTEVKCQSRIPRKRHLRGCRTSLSKVKS